MSLSLRLALLAVIGFAAQPVLAQDNPNLNIYTYDGFAAEWGSGPGLKAGFEATCNCTVNFIAADTSIGALRRVQLEGDTTEADIVLGLDTSVIAEARATNLFVDHGVDTSALDLPNDWQAADFVPFDYGYFAFIYNTENLSNPPSSFEDLASRDDDLKIIIQDPRSATPGMGLMLWVKAAYGNEAADKWSDLAPHVLTVTRGWSEAYGLFLDGEADMVLSYTSSPAYHIIAEEDKRFAAAAFDEGHYTQIEVAGILQSSPNKELARDFLTYLISADAQATIPTTNWMFPVASIDLPEGFDQLVDPAEKLLLDDTLVGENSAQWIEEMLGALN